MNLEDLINPQMFASRLLRPCFPSTSRLDFSAARRPVVLLPQQLTRDHQTSRSAVRHSGAGILGLVSDMKKRNFACSRSALQLARYWEVVSHLPSDMTAHLVNVLAAPPSDGAYNHLKAIIVYRTSVLEISRFRHVIFTE